MRRLIVTLVIATALGVVASHAQEKLKAASPTPPPGTQKEMPIAGSAQIPEMPGPANAPAKVGDEAVVKPGTTTQSKAARQ
jgi:hypothetical protein